MPRSPYPKAPPVRDPFQKRSENWMKYLATFDADQRKLMHWFSKTQTEIAKTYFTERYNDKRKKTAILVTMIQIQDALTNPQVEAELLPHQPTKPFTEHHVLALCKYVHHGNRAIHDFIRTECRSPPRTIEHINGAMMELRIWQLSTAPCRWPLQPNELIFLDRPASTQNNSKKGCGSRSDCKLPAVDAQSIHLACKR